MRLRTACGMEEDIVLFNDLSTLYEDPGGRDPFVTLCGPYSNAV